jgi:hypothetical protein
MPGMPGMPKGVHGQFLHIFTRRMAWGSLPAAQLSLAPQRKERASENSATFERGRLPPISARPPFSMSSDQPPSPTQNPPRVPQLVYAAGCTAWDMGTTRTYLTGRVPHGPPRSVNTLGGSWGERWAVGGSGSPLKSDPTHSPIPSRVKRMAAPRGMEMMTAGKPFLLRPSSSPPA